jgi:hypothetical protein
MFREERMERFGLSETGDTINLIVDAQSLTNSGLIEALAPAEFRTRPYGPVRVAIEMSFEQAEELGQQLIALAKARGKRQADV